MSADECLKSATDISKLGTILTIWAHPDDETFCAGGIMATAVKNGQKVICVIATKGEIGTKNPKKWPPKKMGALRSKEVKEALSILGVGECYCLNYMDGACVDVPEQEAISRLRTVIKEYQPDSILTFGPEGLTGHPDHSAVSKWTDKVLESINKPPKVYHSVQTHEQYKRLEDADKKLNIFFNIDQPPLKNPEECGICYKLPREIGQLKYRAFAAMPSQTEKMFELFDEQFICSALGTEAFVKAS